MCIVGIGSCQCYAGYESADCSVHGNLAPETSSAWQYGLCDVRTMNCSHVIVYGNNFINSPNLTCHFQETKVQRVYLRCKKTVFPEQRISIFLALSQTPVYTAKPLIHGQCITQCACFFPSFCWYSLRLPMERWPS